MPIDDLDRDYSKNFRAGIRNYLGKLDGLGEKDLYYAGQDIIIDADEGPEDDPQIAGTSIRKGPDYLIARPVSRISGIAN